MKRAILLIGLWFCATPTFAEVQADVQKATQSVYRIWLGIPLPNGFVKQLDGSYIQAMQTQNFTEQVPLKGMILLDKKSGKTKELTGDGILFQYAAHNYLLVASASAFAVSDKGDLVTNARFADNTGTVETMFVDASGLRDMGENGGHAEVFALTKNPSNVSAIELRPAKQVARDVNSDLAIIHADGLPTTALKLADSQFAKPADLMFALGAEGESNQLSGKTGVIDRVDYLAAIASEGKLEKRVKQKTVGLWLHSAPFSGSMSGGALVNQCGQVLGVNQVSDKNPYDFQAAIDVGELLPMLRKHSIAFKQFQGRCGGVVAKAENIADGAERVVKAAQHNPRGWLTVLGLALFGLAVCAVAFRLLRWAFAKRRETRNVPQSHSPNHAQPNYPHNQNVHQPHVTPAAPRTMLDLAGSVMLNAITGNVNTIAVPPNRFITVGRRNDCDVVLNHAKVSGQHLKLWIDNGAVWVQDLGSTNGTFVNGAAIHSATRLMPNDVLQLTADDSVASFRLPTSSSQSNTPAPRTQLHQPNTQLHNPTPRVAAILQPLDANLPRVDIPFSGSLNIGRANDNDVVINQPQISGKHCNIGSDAHGNLTLQDLGSTNGTFVDNTNHRITQATLVRVGQVIYLADKNVGYRIQSQ